MQHCLFLLSIFALWGCTNSPASEEQPSRDYAGLSASADTLILISGTADGEELLAMVNQVGDTVIPFGKLVHSFSDTITQYGMVIVSDGAELIGINNRGERMYEGYLYDNGPDYLKEGLFRVMRNGVIGYADSTGQLVIEPRFACATPFEEGRAKVALTCELVSDSPDDEHKRMESDSWFFIDPTGQKVE